MRAGTTPAREGILPAQAIAALTEAGGIRPSTPYAPDQIQPASLDLRLGERAYRVRTSFLPGASRTVGACVEGLSLHAVDLRPGAVLETGCVYIAELQEGLALPPDLAASANPKSSTGRIDVFTRVITDRAEAFDQVEAGYTGPLYAEISPRTFPVLVRTGSRLSQIRFRRGQPRLNETELAALHARTPLVNVASPSLLGGVAVSVDLSGFDGLIGYRPSAIPASSTSTPRVSTASTPSGSACPRTAARASSSIPASSTSSPPRRRCRCRPITPRRWCRSIRWSASFRVHYAGFFDPGFGHAGAGGAGARAVLEVRSRDVPFLLEDGQIVGRLVYERMSEEPATLYGAGAGSNYQAQG